MEVVNTKLDMAPKRPAKDRFSTSKDTMFSLRIDHFRGFRGVFLRFEPLTSTGMASKQELLGGVGGRREAVLISSPRPTPPRISIASKVLGLYSEGVFLLH